MVLENKFQLMKTIRYQLKPLNRFFIGSYLTMKTLRPVNIQSMLYVYRNKRQIQDE